MPVRSKRKTKRRPISSPAERPSRRLDRLFQPVDIAGLVFFRIAFGAVMLWEFSRYFWNNWVWETYVAPRVHFTYFGFEWVRPWPGVGMEIHFLVLAVCAGMIVLGLYYRTAVAVFCVAFWYVALLDQAVYLNHFYLVGVLSFLLIFVPAERAFSLDARRKPQLASSTAPTWALWLLRAQVAIPYFFGGLVKLNGDWLHGQPMQLWMRRMAELHSFPAIYGEEWLSVLFSYGGLLLDLLVIPGLVWRRTRPFAFCAATMFHLMNATMFDIGIFPWLMICATTLFLSPDWPRRLLRLPRIGPPPPATEAALTPWRRLALGFFAAYFLIQILIPLRQWFYPGNVDWTEEGSRFAWRMMLHDKQAAMVFFSRDPKTGVQEQIDIQPFVNARQLDKLSHNPELARQFAVMLKEDFARQGKPEMEVHVFLLCSLNGRKPQLLIDPAVDLGAQPARLGPQPWIVPLTEPLPTDPWDIPPHEWGKHLDIQAIYGGK